MMTMNDHPPTNLLEAILALLHWLAQLLEGWHLDKNQSCWRLSIHRFRYKTI